MGLLEGLHEAKQMKMCYKLKNTVQRWDLVFMNWTVIWPHGTSVCFHNCARFSLPFHNDFANDYRFLATPLMKSEAWFTRPATGFLVVLTTVLTNRMHRSDTVFNKRPWSFHRGLLERSFSGCFLSNSGSHTVKIPSHMEQSHMGRCSVNRPSLTCPSVTLPKCQVCAWRSP